MTAWLLSQAAPYILTAGAALVAVLAAFFKGRSDGRKLEQDALARARLEARTEADKIDDAVAGMSDAEVLERQKQWSRR